MSQRLSASGLFLTIAVVSIAASAFPALRPSIGGLSLHPYAVLVALLFPMAVGRMQWVAPRLLVSAFAFVSIYAIAMIPAGFHPGEIVKVATAGLTALAVATGIRNEKDVTYVSAALVVAAALIGLRGLVLGAQSEIASAGINPMEGIGNKNSYSLYALPSLLIAGFVFSALRVPRAFLIVVGAASVVVTLAVFSTANRSGWLGVIMVALMLLWGRLSARTFALVSAAAVGVWALMTFGGGAEVIERRVDLTREGYESDELRLSLVEAAVEVGLENPVLGVGPQALPRVLASRLHWRRPVVDPHNLLGHVVGGTGLLGFGALVAILVSLWFVRRRSGPGVDQAVFIVRMVLVLWLFRGMFSREVLYAPSFAAAIGLAVGLVGLRERAAALAAPRQVLRRERTTPPAVAARAS